jgi:hypothetical protein
VIVYPQHLIGPILIGVAVVVGGLFLLWMISGFLGIGIISLVRGHQRQDDG